VQATVYDVSGRWGRTGCDGRGDPGVQAVLTRTDTPLCSTGSSSSGIAIVTRMETPLRERDIGLLARRTRSCSGAVRRSQWDDPDASMRPGRDCSQRSEGAAPVRKPSSMALHESLSTSTTLPGRARARNRP